MHVIPIIIIAVFIVVNLAFPRGVRYLFVAPVLGVVFGGFTWSVCAIAFSVLNDLHVFCASILGGILTAEVALFLNSSD